MRGFLLAYFLIAVAFATACYRPRRTDPSRRQEVDYFAKKRECLELATKRTARDEESTAKHLRTGVLNLKPEQCYVSSMNTCLYESGFTSVTTDETTVSVGDLLTGR